MKCEIYFDAFDDFNTSHIQAVMCDIWFSSTGARHKKKRENSTMYSLLILNINRNLPMNNVI